MKNILKATLIAVTVVFAFTGCDLFNTSVSPSERVSMFVSDLNSSNRSTIYQNFHPDADDSDNVKTPIWWDNFFSYTYAPYSISMVFYGESNGVKTYTGTITTDISSYDDLLIKFKEENSGNENWLITYIYFNNNEALK